MEDNEEIIEFLKMEDITLYDLCAEDHRLSARLRGNKLINIKIENEDGEIILQDDEHIYAWESLVYFAKQVLYYDKKIQKDLETYD